MIYEKRKEDYRGNLEQMYLIILDQCINSMNAKILIMDTWETVTISIDTIRILQFIRVAKFEYEAQKYPFVVFCCAVK